MGWLSDLLWLVFPEVCGACNRPLNSGEDCICISCRLHLPKTDFHLEKENMVVKHFWGKIPVEAATAAYHFTKGEKVQNLIHHLKYKDRKDIGSFIGDLYGHALKQAEPYSSVEVVVPVPLHQKKLRKRGYNQSECFAEGLSQAMQIPCAAKAVKRIVDTDTQTRKRRYQRFQNVNRVFEVAQPQAIQGKHVLLVDDVITTGATLTACAETLLELPGTKVSIAAIAQA
jgi:ComF family protein